MPGIVTTLPIGLLGYLGIKNDGQYPQALINQLAPIMDVRDWLMVANCNTIILETIALAAIGITQFATTQVPEGKMRLCRSICVSATLIATDSARYRAVIQHNVTGMVVREGSDAQSSLTDAVASASIQSLIHGPVLMRPGEIVSIKTSKWASATTINTGVQMLFQDFPL